MCAQEKSGEIEWDPVVEDIWNGMIIRGNERERRRDTVLPFLVETGDWAVWVVENETVDPILQSLASVSGA